MNNVPFDRALIGPVIFNEGNAPPVDLNVPTMLKQLLPRIAATLLNRAIEVHMMNPGRMAALNTLVENNFQNPKYPEWLELTLRLCVLKAMDANNLSLIPSFIEDAVNEALTFLASVITASRPEIYANCDFRMQSAANQNVAKLKNTINQLSNINLFGLEKTMASPISDNYQHSYAAPVANNNRVWGTVTSSQPTHAQQNQTTVNWEKTVQPEPVTNFSLSQKDWFESKQYTEPPVQPPEPVVPEWSYVKQQTNQQPVQQEILERVYTVVQTTGGHELDLNNHALPYFGSSQLIDLSTRREDLRSDVFQTVKDSRNLKGTDSELINRTLEAENNLEEAILTARIRSAAIRSVKPGLMVYRQFFSVLNPTVCLAASKVMLDGFKMNRSIHDLPKIFRNFVDYFENTASPSAEEQEALNFYSFVDNRLAHAVNTFLKKGLHIEKPTLISFSAGLEPLMDFLTKNKSERHTHAFNSWATQFTNMLSKELQNEALEEHVKSYNIAEPYTMAFVPELHSVTMVNLTSKELGYKISDSFMLIDPKTTPVLSDIVSSLLRNKKDLGIYTTEDWIVTADGIKYGFAEHAVEKGSFFLFK